MWRAAGEQEQAGGAGVVELAEDGSQRVHGTRRDPLSLSGTHVSLLHLHLHRKMYSKTGILSRIVFIYS